MVVTSTASHAFDKLAIDLVGPLPVTERYNKYILTVQCDLSKYIFVLPIPDMSADTVSKVLVEKVFLTFGSPSGILSDQGSNFMSKLFISICKFWRIHKVRTTPYHPESNGSLEKSHWTLKNFLRSFTNKQQTDWDLWCRFAQFSYNTTPHTSTKYSPFELVFGRKAKLPSVITKTPAVLYNYDNYLLELKHKLQNANKLAVESLHIAKIRSKGFYDKKATQSHYKPGDMVLLRSHNASFGHPLFPKWSGPYEVVQVPSKEGVIIKIRNSLKRYHFNMVKPYYT